MPALNDNTLYCHLVDRANSDNLVVPGTLTVNGVSIAGSGPTADNNAAVAEAVSVTGTANTTTHITWAAQLVTGTDITAPDTKTFQANSNGMYVVYVYCQITPAISDAGARILKLIGGATGNGASPIAGSMTALWTPDGVSDGTGKKIKMTFCATSYMTAGDQVQLDFENRDATNSTPLADVYMMLKKLY